MGSILPLQIHTDGWAPVAEVRPIGDAGVPSTPTHLEYDFDHAAERLEAQGHLAVSVSFPVSFELHRLDTWPAFLLDLLPQGHARRLVDARNREGGDTPSDWNALRAGAGNPVGNLRVPRPDAPPPGPGLTRDDVVERGDGLRAWAEAEGIPMTGSSDTGGAAPKLLLTEAEDGLLYADGVLPDDRARAHWIVKFPRGRTRRDAQVLANEGPYLEVCRRLGLRCGAPSLHRDGALFVPRFDRRVTDAGVERLGLESLYSAMGVVEPGAPLRQEDAVHAILAHTRRPAEALEYVLRDAVAWALGDTDNHGRNTSLLKDLDGTVVLSPLYDVAPMFLDPDLVKRTSRWRSETGDGPDWEDVARFVEGLLPDLDVRGPLRELGEMLADPGLLQGAGVDDDVRNRRRSALATTVRALEGL